MNEIEKRVSQLLASPRGLFYLGSTAATRFHGPKLPEGFSYWGAIGSDGDSEGKVTHTALSVLEDWQWRGDKSWVEGFRHHEAELREVATLLVSQGSGSWWWWEPLRRGHQVWLDWPQENQPEPRPDFVPDLREWRYDGMKPRRATWTSTWVGGILSTWLYEAWEGDPDLPLAVWWLQVDPAARVFEIHEPADWIELCSRYPKDTTEFHHGGPVPGATRFITPDWPRVAQDWEGVHLSMAGLLTASSLPLDVPGHGRTYLEGWHTESTVWFRWAFTTVTRLPDWTDPLPLRMPQGPSGEKLERLHRTRMRPGGIQPTDNRGGARTSPAGQGKAPESA